MKFLTATFLTALLAFISGLFLPWWGMAITSLLVAVLIHQKAGKAFLAGLLAVTGLIGGLVAGLAALSGSFLRSTSK